MNLPLTNSSCGQSSASIVRRILHDMLLSSLHYVVEIIGERKWKNRST